MDDKKSQKLRDLLRAHESRLHILELQAAQLGVSTPPHVITEIDNIRAEIDRISAELTVATPMDNIRAEIDRISAELTVDIPAVTRATLRQLRQQALKAYYAQDWAQAEDLLVQMLASDPDNSDMRTKLNEVQRQIDLQAFYQAICEMRNEGRSLAVLNALSDLERQQPGYPDSEGLRIWADTVAQPSQTHQGTSVTCLDCGAKNNPDDEFYDGFCYMCGRRLPQKDLVTSLAQPSQTHQGTSVTCLDCGAKNYPDNRFCDECGASLVKK